MKKFYLFLVIILQLFNIFSAQAETKNLKTLKSKEEFNSYILNSKQLPVLMIYSASWCRPCHKLHRVLEQIESQFLNKLVFVSVDLDEHPFAHQMKITGYLPEMQLYKTGKSDEGEFLENHGDLTPKVQQKELVNRLNQALKI